MKSISKKDWARLQETVSTLPELKAKLEGIIDQAQAQIETVLDEIRNIKDDAHGQLDDLANQAQEYYDERSDNWRDGDAGSQYSDWIQQIETARDAFAEDLDFSIDASNVLDPIDEMINQLDGELQQSYQEC